MSFPQIQGKSVQYWAHHRINSTQTSQRHASYVFLNAFSDLKCMISVIVQIQYPKWKPSFSHLLEALLRRLNFVAVALFLLHTPVEAVDDRPESAL